MENLKQYPLIIIFYLNTENNSEIKEFSEVVNQMIIDKEANIISFFIPTKDDSRVECINPVVVNPTDMDKIMATLDDIKKSFDIGGDINIPDTEITPDDRECTCNGGKCNC